QARIGIHERIASGVALLRQERTLHVLVGRNASRACQLVSPRLRRHAAVHRCVVAEQPRRGRVIERRKHVPAIHLSDARAGGAYWALRANISLVSLESLQSRVSLESLRTRVSLESLRTSVSLQALRARVAFGPLRTSSSCFTLRTGGSCWTLRAGGS